MAIQHADIFHCLGCGRIVYTPHGGEAPSCCARTMVRAVAGVVQRVPYGVEMEPPAHLEEHALLAELIELSNWCRGTDRLGNARYEELAHRLQALKRAVVDRFDDEERTGVVAKVVASAERRIKIAQRLRDEKRRFCASLHQFVEDLFHGESSFRGWSEVCERLDSLTADFRHHQELENELVRNAIDDDTNAPR